MKAKFNLFCVAISAFLAGISVANPNIWVRIFLVFGNGFASLFNLWIVMKINDAVSEDLD
jgi:hypothetical protein